MNIESVREYCLSLPLVAEAFPFDEQTLVFRILGKIFACVDLERPEWVTMKCNADYALELREVHPEIEGAWHWNKKYWNQVNLYGTLEDDFIQTLIRHSYSEVVKKLKKQEKLEHPEIMEVGVCHKSMAHPLLCYLLYNPRSIVAYSKKGII